MYNNFIVIIKGGKSFYVRAIDMDAAAADVLETYANAEIIQVMLQ